MYYLRFRRTGQQAISQGAELLFLNRTFFPYADFLRDVLRPLESLGAAKNMKTQCVLMVLLRKSCFSNTFHQFLGRAAPKNLPH